MTEISVQVSRLYTSTYPQQADSLASDSATRSLTSAPRIGYVTPLVARDGRKQFGK